MNYLRSFLFAPGSNARVMRKALDSPADAVILDLEDAVAVTGKDEARQQVADLLRTGPRHRRTYLRINGLDTPWAAADLEAALALEVTGVMLPKAENPAAIATLAAHLPEGCDLIPLVETARGVLKAEAIAACSARISRLAFGAIDFTMDIGTEYAKSGLATLHARSHLVLVSRVAGLLPPVDSVFPDLQDADGLAAEIAAAREIGLFGKLAIHPAQLGPIHAAFTPGAEETDRAREVVRLFEAAERDGVAALQAGGQFIDYPVYRRAQKVLALAQLLEPAAGRGVKG